MRVNVIKPSSLGALCLSIALLDLATIGYLPNASLCNERYSALQNDPRFHRKYRQAGVMTYGAHCTGGAVENAISKIKSKPLKT